MNKHISALIFMVLFLSNADAGENYVTGGLNISRFYDVDSKPLVGFSLGCGREWQLSNSSSLTFCISCFFRGALLENKVIHPFPGDMVNVYDIYCRIVYLDVPIYYRWYFVNDVERRLYLTTGLAAGLAVYDASARERLRWWRDSDFPEEKADYYWNEDPGFLYVVDSSTIDVLLGSGIRWQKVALEGQIRINLLGDVDTLATIRSLATKFITLTIGASWYF